MFGTRQWPEQFSRHEWQTSSLPFAPAARAYFHTCRSARWFAPYFARTFGVEAYGYHYYTTFSRTKDRFSWVPPGYSRQAPLYVFGCRGRKSDGWVGAAAKYAGLTAPERMKRYTATAVGATGYDPVADLYDAAFEDIRVRADEWRWLDAHLRSAKPLRVLDIGCGNGSLLCQLAPRLSRGVGLDVSSALVLRARANAERRGVADRLTFQSVMGPALPLADRSLDCAVSLLSFRYLDWDPLIAEVLRVLVPGGRLLVVDMVQSPLRIWQTPALLSSKARVLCAEGA
jgi:predicted O-methyltransferase YrrM